MHLQMLRGVYTASWKGRYEAGCWILEKPPNIEKFFDI